MEVSGYVNSKRELVYKCPSCLRNHTHGWRIGHDIEPRVSHCSIDDRSVRIKVENFAEAMATENERRMKSNAKCSLNYYHNNKMEVQKRKLLRRMAQGYTPKLSTLVKYQIPQPELVG